MSGPPRSVGHSVLVVPVPALEDFVRRRHEHYDRAYVSVDPTFAHAHVTVLGPFVDLADLPSASDGIAAIAAATNAFAFSLRRLETFPNGIIHLLPEPEEPFARLTTALWQGFPAYPPYAGLFPHVRPHVTLDAVGPGVTERVVLDWVSPLLPAHGLADRLQLSWYEPGACRTLACWPLAPAPGPNRSPALPSHPSEATDR